MGNPAMRIFLVCILLLSGLQSSSAALCGNHGTPMKGPAEEPATLTAEKFWNEYVRKAEPVVIRGALSEDESLKLWDDEYMLKHYGDYKVRMEAKDEGGARMENMPSVDTMKNF